MGRSADAAVTVCTMQALHRQTTRWWVHRRYNGENQMTITYTDEIGIAICTRIIEGETIKEICADADLPSERTVFRWLAAEPTFWRLYMRAREAQMEKWCEEIVEIADDARNDYMDRLAKNGEIERVYDPEAVQRSRLRIETRKWVMSKLAAKRYGDKVDVSVNATLDVSTLSDAELEARTKARLLALGIKVTGPLLLGPTTAAGDPDDDDPDDDGPKIH